MDFCDENCCFGPERCQNKGLYALNLSGYHKICESHITSCNFLKLFECVYCKSTFKSSLNLPALKSNPKQSEENSQSSDFEILDEFPENQLSLINPVNNFEVHLKRNQNKFSSSPKARTSKNFEKFDCICDFCQSLNEDLSQPLQCEHLICLNCLTNEKCPICYSEDFCLLCSSLCTVIFSCGHPFCKSCLKITDTCPKCTFSQQQKSCEFCGFDESLEVFPACGHKGCLNCLKNSFCYRDLCVRNNFLVEKNFQQICVVCRNSCFKCLELICGHFVCFSCFTLDLKAFNYVCWSCYQLYHNLRCFDCKKIAFFEVFYENVVHKVCCKRNFCKDCFQEIGVDLDSHVCCMSTTLKVIHSIKKIFN